MQTTSPILAQESSATRAAGASGRRATYLAALRRFLVIAAIAFWLGGFTFYAGVAIPMGVQVLGGHRTVGFVTERVTNWLNLAGGVALAILLWETMAGWRGRGRRLNLVLLATWAFMACVQVELVCMHPVMDRLLDPHAREVLDDDRFDLLHHVYLWSTTAQWFMGVIYVAAIALAWGPRASAAAQPAA